MRRAVHNIAVAVPVTIFVGLLISVWVSSFDSPFALTYGYFDSERHHPIRFALTSECGVLGYLQQGLAPGHRTHEDHGFSIFSGWPASRDVQLFQFRWYQSTKPEVDAGAPFRYSFKIAVPHGLVLLILGTFISIPLRKRQAAYTSGRCAVCGYDLRATPNRCPECGTIPSPGYNPTHAETSGIRG